jgi:flagellar biosynthetic protein FliP
MSHHQHQPMNKNWAFTLRALIALVGGMVLADPALAQAFSLDLGEGGPTATERLIQLFLLVTVMALAPSILVMTTSFIRIVIVLSFLRTAMGAQGTPPNQVLIALALFLTFFIMSPTFEAAWEQGIRPYVDGQIDEKEAFEKSLKPLHNFMQKFARDQDLKLFMDVANIAPVATPDDIPIKVLIPAFIISELRRAFEIGFLVFIPFLVIDMVVASVLMSMGMMMLPPVIIALPFKIIFFVLVDGWFLIVGSLVQSFGALGT